MGFLLVVPRRFIGEIRRNTRFSLGIVWIMNQSRVASEKNL